MRTFHSLQIKEITHETSETVSISVNVPSHLAADFTFIPGQYLNLSAEINGVAVRRSYSICSAPNDGELRVAIKRIKNGVFSTYATTVLKEGDFLNVATPEGRFVLNTTPENNANYAAFAAGSGITPILSMVKTVLTQEPNSTFVLVYGSKTPKDTIFYDTLSALQTAFPERFSLYYSFTQANESDALFGRISIESVNYILKNKHKETTFNHFYLCGPEAMITTVSNELLTNGIPKETIHYELFTASENASSNKTDIAFSGTARVTVLVDDEETTMLVKEDETLLDAALKEGIDAPYSCQGGVCSSCICLVTEGKVSHLKNSILTDEELSEGLALACQAIPKSDVIAIDFDNS